MGETEGPAQVLCTGEIPLFRSFYRQLPRSPLSVEKSGGSTEDSVLPLCRVRVSPQYTPWHATRDLGGSCTLLHCRQKEFE